MSTQSVNRLRRPFCARAKASNDTYAIRRISDEQVQIKESLQRNIKYGRWECRCGDGHFPEILTHDIVQGRIRQGAREGRIQGLPSGCLWAVDPGFAEIESLIGQLGQGASAPKYQVFLWVRWKCCADLLYAGAPAGHCNAACSI